MKITEMEEKLNSLCIKTVDYKENDRLITLCTAEKGKVLVKAAGCKSPKAKLKFAASPLCFGEYIVIERGGRYTLKGCEPYDTFSELAKDLKRYYAGFSVLEWIDKLSNENETETCRGLLLYGTDALKNLAYSETSPEKIILEFMISALEISGYKLNLSTCAVSGKSLDGSRICYDFYAGGVVLFENRSMDYIEITPDDAAILKGDNSAAAPAEYKKLIYNIESVMCYAANIKKNYSLGEFLKL